jgi:hypothetical protein
MAAPLGNSNARKENRLWSETIKRAVAQNDAVKLRAAADKLVELAVAGDVSALRELGDRLDGKPKQQIEATGADDGPLRIVHESK